MQVKKNDNINDNIQMIILNDRKWIILICNNKIYEGNDEIGLFLRHDKRER